MPVSKKKSAVAKFRGRMKRAGAVRVEVLVAKHDAALVREVAAALSDPARRESTRAALRRELAQSQRRSLKELLAAAPLDGIDLTRSRDPDRPVEL